jgi:transposase
MKTKLQVQFNNTNVETTEIEKLAKEDLKEKGVKMNSIDTLDVYYKPEELAVYYVATLKDETVVSNENAISIA